MMFVERRCEVLSCQTCPGGTCDLDMGGILEGRLV